MLESLLSKENLSHLRELSLACSCAFLLVCFYFLNMYIISGFLHACTHAAFIICLQVEGLFFLLITAVDEAIEAIVGIQIGDAENPKVD